MSDETAAWSGVSVELAKPASGRKPSMAEVLEALPEWAGQGRRETYLYDLWFDGKPWLLTRGEDFTQERRGMAHRIRHAAKRRGVEVTVAHREFKADDWQVEHHLAREGDEVIVVQGHLDGRP